MGYLVKEVKITSIFVKITHLLIGTINDPIETKIPLLLFPLNTCNFSSFASFYRTVPHLRTGPHLFLQKLKKKIIIFFFYFILFLWFTEQKVHISVRNPRKFLGHYSQTLENFTFTSFVSFPNLGKILIIFLSSYLILYF